MPQITIEYSSNIIEKDSLPKLLMQIHQLLEKMLSANINSCKSRAYECNTFMVGDNKPERGFVHTTLKLLPGRTEMQIQQLEKECMNILSKNFATSLSQLQLQITLEISELSTFYSKVASDD